MNSWLENLELGFCRRKKLPLRRPGWPVLEAGLANLNRRRDSARAGPRFSSAAVGPRAQSRSETRARPRRERNDFPGRAKFSGDFDGTPTADELTISLGASFARTDFARTFLRLHRPCTRAREKTCRDFFATRRGRKKTLNPSAVSSRTCSKFFPALEIEEFSKRNRIGRHAARERTVPSLFVGDEG